VKSEFFVAKKNSIWQIGDGTKVSFWNDIWCEKPITQFLNLNHDWHNSLSSRVSNFIL